VRLISFSMTKQQFRDRSKTVTRRLGWANLKPGEQLRAVEKAQGLKKGEKVVDLGIIRVVSARREPISAITLEDVIREGFPDLTAEEFISLFCKANKCEADREVTRIEYEYV
jgi:hypothetical protein